MGHRAHAPVSGDAVGTTRNGFIASLAGALALPITARATAAAASTAAGVREEFLHAWHGYRRNAWGRDEVRPVSGTAHDFFITGHSLGLSIVEALDTLYVLECDEELADAVAWLRADLSFDVDGDVQMFEAVIRLVGGLLAGFYATGKPFLLAAARDLADRLYPCFEKSPSGAPYRFVNLRTGAVSGNVTNLAEAATNILEFGELSRLTGNAKYLDAATKAYAAIIARRSPLDLLATSFDVERGVFVDAEDVGPNPPGDSFYEYLWGAWVLFGDVRAREWYGLLTDAILKHERTRIDGPTWFANVDYGTGALLPAQSQSELAAFYAELLAKSGNLRTGEFYYDSFTAVEDRFGLIPEQFDYRTLRLLDPGYQLRPEYANSAFDLWFLTGRDKYRATARRHFARLREHCRVAGGYTIVTDVTTRPMKHGDLCPAYCFAENFKYLYLMFADSPRFDGTSYYLSTEGKIFRGLR